jgi:regulator of sigma E protease
VELLALNLLSSLDSTLNILLVALGLGLVIFIHELGHFLVAKWCGVKVERFSIGFGPILWKYTRGETEYALSAVPFGGYVKMLGQDDADPSQMANERIARDPRSYTAKTVPQRMAIISAGVINNMVSAVLFFVIAFMFGVKYQPAVVGQVIPGKPAWVSGLRLGDKITRINDRISDQLGFIDIRQAVALSAKDEDVLLEGQRDGKHFSTTVRPELQPGGLFPTMFVEAELGLTLPDAREGGLPTPAVPGLSAAAASPPFEFGDELIDIDGTRLTSYADLQKTLAAKRNQTVEISVRRKGQPESAPLTKITVGPNHFRTLGLKMAIGKIKAIQHGSPAENELRVGDTITHITDENGQVLRVGVDIDPLKLPDYFASRAGQEVLLKVKREVEGGNPATPDLKIVPENRPGWIERAPESIDDCPLSIPAIGVAFHVLNYVVDVTPDGPAAKAGLAKDDNLMKMKFVLPKDAPDDGVKDRKDIEVVFKENDRNWPQAFWMMQQYPLRNVVLTVKSLGAAEQREVTVVPQSEADWYLPMRGFTMQPLFMTRKAANIGDALALGFHHTRDSILDMWLTIRGLTSGRISPKALGGPIRIAGTAYYFTKQGIPDLILFLGMLSVSLAVLNFLPIPVLDGGHFMFLCWEGVRGKPPSDWVVVTATYVGLALVLSLMAWVMYMDISGLIG